jgi:hypothetical protein
MDAQKLYDQIVALEGQESATHPGQPVWVPAVANGGLFQLLQELASRGWSVFPPMAQVEFDAPGSLGHQTAVIDRGNIFQIVLEEGTWWCACRDNPGMCAHTEAAGFI